jgi:hypothetical protein
MTDSDFQRELRALIQRAASTVDHEVIHAIMKKETDTIDADLHYFCDRPTMTDDEYSRNNQ